ncbi:MAG TPA: right-handed parallel beta-helix repeat-containing protein [Streptosporangiaceae bacterium]
MNTPNWIDAQASGADPTGARDSTAAISAALAKAAACVTTPGAPSVVYLASGTYTTTAPLVIPPGVALLGDTANEMSSYSDIATGSIIQPAATFAQGTGPANGVIVIPGQAAGSRVVSEEHKITGIFVDGSRLPAGNTADGITITGNARRVHLARIMIAHTNGNGFSAVADGHGNVPDALRLQRVMTRWCGLAGFLIFRVSDCTFIDCLAENCTGNGWDITNLSNCTLIGCRSEHNNIGYAVSNTNEGTGSGGGKLVGCSTDRNQQHGIAITTRNSTGVPVILSGCAFRRDGRNKDAGGGGFAGIDVSGYPGVVQVSGCTVFPGVNDDGSGTNSPQTGLNVSSTAALKATVIVSGSYIQAAGTAIADDGLGTVLLDRSTALATGPTSAPSIIGPVSALQTDSRRNFAAERVIGTYTIQPGDVIAGTAYEFWGAGAADGTGTPALQIRLRIGGIAGPVLAATGAVTCRTASSMAFGWRGRIAFTAAGVSGATIDAVSDITETFASAGPALHSGVAQGAAAGDTTQPVTVVVTAQWSKASTSNAVRTTSGTIRRTSH